MANVQIALCDAMDGATPVYSPRPVWAEYINSTSSSLATTNQVTLPGPRKIRVNVPDGARISVAIGRTTGGAALTATSTNGLVCGSGTHDFGFLNEGDFVSIIDVT